MASPHALRTDVRASLRKQALISMRLRGLPRERMRAQYEQAERARARPPAHVIDQR